ncbi:hypothetical protein [Alkalihalobacillus sp. R86527]|uniref:hypothetical protein n=1 Tax=Alkalihalobacillus sp. R86527 TaxID=3093863 RepID=UPI00366B62E1
MAIDFDPFDVMDMNYNMEVDANDLQMYELQEHGTYSIDDIDHDMVMDAYDYDIGNDNQIDSYQVDLNHNNVVDEFETHFGMTEWNFDTNVDGTIDYVDRALGQQIYGV